MRALYLLRHSLTEGNERRLYIGATDLPLSPAGVALAQARRAELDLPDYELYVTSGLRRADETLYCLTGRAPDVALPDLREMDFGAFEGRNYEHLKDDPNYSAWINDASGAVACPGGESREDFNARVQRSGASLLATPWRSALVITHGGVIVRLMADWFPGERRGFYDWQPEPCAGWRVRFDGIAPVDFIGL